MKPIPQHTSAFSCFIKSVQDSDSGTGPITWPELFKYCTVILDNVSWTLELSFPNWSICIAANAAMFWLMKLESSHPMLVALHMLLMAAWTGWVDQKLYVQDVVEYAAQIHPVLKHFRNSGKCFSSEWYHQNV